MGADQNLIWSYTCVFLPSMSTAMRTSHFVLWELSMSFYIFHRHIVCLVDCVDLISNFYSWWKGFASSSLVTLPLGFNCGFISIYACGSSTGVYSWGRPGRLGFAPLRASYGGGAAAWLMGTLVAPSMQGHRLPPPQELWPHQSLFLNLL